MRAAYIVIEGGEHVGKTTQVSRIAEGFGAITVR